MRNRSGRIILGMYWVSFGLAAIASALEPVRGQTIAVMPDVDRSTLIVGDGTHDWVGRGRLLDRGDGTWLYLYVRGKHHAGSDLSKKVHVRFSTDEGMAWTEADMLPDGTSVQGMPLAPPERMGYSEVDLIRCPDGDLLALYRRNAHDGERLGVGILRSRDGGRSWKAKGIVANERHLKHALDHVVVDGLILAPFIRSVRDGAPTEVVLLASADQGRTWQIRSTIADQQWGCNETGIVRLGGEDLLVICRTRSEEKTLQRYSRDLGRTWEPWRDITHQVGVVQQPRLRRFSSWPGRIFLFGRHRYEETVQRNGLWFSDDRGASWLGFDLDERDFIDTGYGDALFRKDGTMVYLAYRGRDGQTNLMRYLLQIPSF